MGKRKKSKLSLLSHYALARSAGAIFKTLPLSLAAKFGQALGAMFYRFDHRHRERVASQIKNAFGEKYSEEECLELTRKMYDHFGTMLAEFVRTPLINRDNVDRFVNWGDRDKVITEELARGKGVIFATGHIGNWEASGSIFALKNFSRGAIARPLDNPYIDKYVRSIRETSGQEIWDKFGALRNVVRVLKNGEGFGILTDQDAGQRGLFVPFFGIQASTIPTVADLAIRTGASIIPSAMQREGGPMEYIYRSCDPIRPEPGNKSEEERLRLLTEMNISLEHLISQAPEQWLWLHRRWKTRPSGEKIS